MDPTQQLLSNSDLAVGWVGGKQVENHATLWPNLQDCNISSIAETSKLDQVWQYRLQMIT